MCYIEQNIIIIWAILTGLLILDYFGCVYAKLGIFSQKDHIITQSLVLHTTVAL